MDLRLIAATKRAFRISRPIRRQVLVDLVQRMLGCTHAQATDRLEDLIAAGFVVVRGHASASLVFPGPNLDTEVLRRDTGVEVPRHI